MTLPLEITHFIIAVVAIGCSANPMSTAPCIEKQWGGQCPETNRCDTSSCIGDQFLEAEHGDDSSLLLLKSSLKQELRAEESAHFPAAPATNTAADEDADVTSPKRRAYLEDLVPSLIDRALDDAQPFGTTSQLQTFGTNTNAPKDHAQAYAACVGSRTPAMIIISVVANLPEEYVSLLRANRLMVAEPFNYTYCHIGHSLDTDRDVAWSKVIAVRHFLAKQSQPVVWMDADAIFMTKKIAFEEFTGAKFKTKDILFTEDIGGRPINSGVFVTKNTAWTRSFWKSIYNDFFPKWKKKIEWHSTSGTYDQRAIVEYRDKYPDDMSAHTAIEPCCVMNNVGHWSGKFIAHPAGGHNKEHKYQKLTSILKEMHG